MDHSIENSPEQTNSPEPIDSPEHTNGPELTNSSHQAIVENTAPETHPPTPAQTQQFTTVAEGEDFPMVVWLRGDESYAEDFKIDADEAMKMIGIRRSRLTQISGKELRVGRRRIGRYIRPVYRSEDVQAYVQWTRPTASHAKSSSIVEDAAKKLFEQSEKLEQNLKQSLANSLNEITSTAQIRHDETVRMQNENLQKLLNEQRSQLQQLSDQFSKTTERLVETAARLESIERCIDTKHQEMQSLVKVNQTLLHDSLTQTKELSLEFKSVPSADDAIAKVKKEFVEVCAQNIEESARLHQELLVSKAEEIASRQTTFSEESQVNHEKSAKMLEALLASQKDVLTSSENTLSSLRSDLNKSNEFIYKNFLTLSKAKNGTVKEQES